MDTGIFLHWLDIGWKIVVILLSVAFGIIGIIYWRMGK